MVSYQKSSKSVALLNCEVKPAHQSEELEVVVKSSTRTENSQKKFDFDLKNLSCKEIRLEGLASASVFKRVSVVAKVIGMKDPVKVSGKLQKQDITIADWTCSKVDAVGGRC